MESNEEKLFLDKASYQKLIEEVEKLKEKLSENAKEKGEAYSGAVGDGWHDNFAFEEANRQERMIFGQLRECYEKLQRVVIVEKAEDENLIDIGDIVNINIIFDLDDIDKIQFRLVGSVGTGANGNHELQEVSINSPLGKAVYHKSVGEKTSYSVENRTYNIEIISKTDEKGFTKEHKINKTR